MVLLRSTLLAIVITVACAGKSQLPCPIWESVNITGGIVNSSDGSIVYEGLRYESKNYAAINFNIQNHTMVMTAEYTRGCLCQVTKCVWFCCWHVTDVDGKPECVEPMLEEMVVTFTDFDPHNTSVDLITYRELHKAMRPLGAAGKILAYAFHDEWSMDSSGHVRSLSSHFSISQDSYCLESELDDENKSIASLLYLTNAQDVERDRTSLCIGIMISIPFLLATLFIYGCVPELRNIHGKSLICYVFALTCTYLVLLHLNMKWHIIDCKLGGILFYFWALVSFFWLNVMCFDIFWTFSSGVVIKNERKRFLFYSLYAWGCPLVFTALLITLDFTDLIPEAWRPNIGLHRCFLYSDWLIEFIYFYSILLQLVMANVYFFVVTAVRIIRIQRATEAALQNDSRRHSKFEKDRYRFSLYLRLFVVMGITWTFELLSWATGKNDYLFYVTDIGNCLLGVIIFFLFVWKKKVRQLAMKRIGTQRTSSRAKSTSINTGYTSTSTKGAYCSEGIPMRQSTDS